MIANGPRTAAALALQALALIVLVLALAGAAWLDGRSKSRVLVLVDRSLSVPQRAAADAVAAVERATKQAGASLDVLEFAGRVGDISSVRGTATASMRDSAAATELEQSSTNLEQALNTALAAHARRAYASAVVISDGFDTAGDSTNAVRAVAQAGLPLQWIAVGRPLPATRIADVSAPARARTAQPIMVGVQLAGQFGEPLRVTATARDASGATQSAIGAPDDDGRVTLELRSGRSGPLLVDVAVENAQTGQRIDARQGAAAVDVTARAATLYVQGAPGPLASSLVAGGWPVEVVSAGRAGAYADGLAGYDSVVLDDVAVSDAPPHFWKSLVDAVRNRGLGLLVLGGERSFGRGGYRDSMLESILPVRSEPAALAQAANIVFAVDKSGSMGESSGGVDRFRLAQRAVLETARGLAERDQLGVLVFDVEPRVLVPLGPSRAGIAMLASRWTATPHGGTKIAPAIDAALDQFESGPAGRRMLVLVTDGFVDDAALGTLRSRMKRLHVETIALAVGRDADVAALERLVSRDDGVVLRVGEAAQLPQTMSTGLEQRRARVEQGSIVVQQRLALPFPPGTAAHWPAIAAFDVTRLQPQAGAWVHSASGEPLIAFLQSGQGRVVAVTCGLGRWTPDWLRWQDWPRLAAGLVDWVGARPGAGSLALSASDRAGSVLVEVDLHGALGWANTAETSVSMTSPAGRTEFVALDSIAPGRLRATAPDRGPGLYAFVVSSPLGSRRLLHLRSVRAEDRSWGISPDLDAWRRAGLVRNWHVEALMQHRTPNAMLAGSPDRFLIALALVLFLAGVFVDRRVHGFKFGKAAGQRRH